MAHPIRKLTGAVVLSLATGLATLPGVTEARGQTTGVAPARPLRARAALSAAIEAHTHGDYEQADVLLQQAQAGSAELSATEQKDLASYQHLNNLAVHGRREASEQIRQAEQAMLDGRTPDAAELLKKVAANRDYLTEADRQKYNQLSDRAWPRTPGRPGDPAGASTSLLARTKLQQARALLARANFDAADRLAREAEALGVTYGTGEDTPRKVRDDVVKARTDPKYLLGAGRAALDRREFDHALQLADAADKASSWNTFPFWADSPSKLRKDVQAARAKTPGMPQSAVTADKESMTVTQSLKAPADNNVGPDRQVSAPGGVALAGQTVEAPARSPSDEKALQIMKQARKALDVGDLDQAERLCKQAAAANPQLQWWEDQYRPETVQADIARQRQAQATVPDRRVAQPTAGPKLDPLVPTTITAGAPKTTPPTPKIETAAAQPPAPRTPPADPRALLREGRDKLGAGKYDDAMRLADRARSAGGSMSWGIFSDTPDKLLKDVDKARREHDREESGRVLAEARKHYDQGDLDGAKKLALQAQKLHGDYSIWDLGDRPSKLLDEIAAGEARRRQAKIPDVPSANNGIKSEYLQGRPDPSRATATGTRPGDSATTTLSNNVGGTPNPTAANNTGGHSPYSELRLPGSPGSATPADTRQVADQQPAGPGVGPQGSSFVLPPSGTSMPDVSSAAKQRARLLVAEARQFQKDNHLVEARLKLQAAQEVGASFSSLEDDSPANVLVQLNMNAYRQVTQLLDEAEDFARSGAANPARMQKADEDLAQARQLALVFKFDTTTIDAKIGWLAQVRSGRPVASNPNAVNPQAGPASPGQVLLQQARQELRCGSYSSARKLAEEAYGKHQDVRPQAENFLRSLDQEELNQHRLEVCHTFDAAERAFREGNYPFAYQILTRVETHMLDEQRQARLKDLMDSPEMQPKQLVQVKGGQTGVGDPPPVSAPPGAGIRSITDQAQTNPDATFLKQTEMMQSLEFQKLRTEASEVQKRAIKLYAAGDSDQAIEALEAFEDRLNKEPLPPDQLALIRRQIDDRVQKFRTLRAQTDFNHEREAVQVSGHKVHEDHLLAQQNRQKKVAELMTQYQDLMANYKYQEAAQKAQLAVDMDPDNAAAVAALKVAEIEHRLYMNNKIKKDNAKKWNEEFDNVFQNPKVDSGLDHEVEVRPEFRDRANKRENFVGGLTLGSKGQAEKLIESKLLAPVNLKFNDTPLNQVLDDLHRWHGINIYLDEAGLSDAGLSIKQPLTTPPLEGISLKSALDLILGQMHLTYVIQNEVLFITTENKAHGKLIKKVFQVADLITPIPDAVVPASAQNTFFGNSGSSQNPQLPGGAPSTPYVGPYGMTNGTPVGTPTSPGLPGSVGNKGGRTRSLEDQLIHLITSSIHPDSWRDMGGPGSIDYYPLGTALIINQTPDIQEQIADLLASLRRLQDLEVAIEVRFITIAEGFNERIGIDFNMNLVTNQNTTRFQPQLLSGNFAPAGFINSFQPNNFLAGLTPAGTYTGDLNIPITTSSFAAASPPGIGNFVGGFPNGGLDIGLAFLSDIQVFLFMEAVQNDQRSNVMQAPKLVMQDGQTATISVSSDQNFVTNVQAMPVGNGQVIIQPTVTNIGTGSIQLTLQPVVSADRRFVRMSLSPTLTNLASASVPLVPIVMTIPQTFEGGLAGPAGPPVLFTQFIQTPIVNTITVQTTVTVPDGGTVLLGGLKRLSEGRNEAGPPVLSKIPYIDRLFRNVGYAREAESLMLMVTPRIIITEEEEKRQTGEERQEQGGR